MRYQSCSFFTLTVSIKKLMRDDLRCCCVNGSKPSIQDACTLHTSLYILYYTHAHSVACITHTFNCHFIASCISSFFLMMVLSNHFSNNNRSMYACDSGTISRTFICQNTVQLIVVLYYHTLCERIFSPRVLLFLKYNNTSKPHKYVAFQFACAAYVM